MSDEVPDLCRNCHFLERNVKARRCLRFPPTPLYVEGTFREVYPYTNLDGWCGEHVRDERPI